MNTFQINESIKKEFDIDSLKIIFDQSEKALVHTHKISENCTDRAYKIIGFVLPSFIACMTYFVYTLQNNAINYIACTLFIACIFLGISLMQTITIIFHYDFYTAGFQPREIAITEIFQNYDKNNPDSIIQYHILLCNLNQKKITLNEQINIKRIKLCTNAILWATLAITAPIIACLFYLLF